MNNTEKLAQEIATLSARLDAATHRLLECIRSFDESAGWHEQGAISCAHWLSWRVGLDPGTAREKVRVARALGKLPAIDEALHSGRLSYSKVRALTRVATPETETGLLDMALIATGAQLERLCRGYRSVIDGGRAPRPEERSVHRRWLPGGMVKLELVLEADEADMILRAVDRAREVNADQEASANRAAAAPTDRCPVKGGSVSAGTPWPTRADGMVKLAESFLASHTVSGSGGERFQVVVHLDQEALGPDGALAGTLEDGTRVPAETLRRVACDCGLVAARHDGQSLDIGRRTRSIPPAIRRALMLRDHGCAFPGCTHAAFLHAHHVEHWLHGGATRLGNLVMLCTFHHHLVHEGGWKVAALAGGAFRFRAPGGTLLATTPPRERVENAPAWLREWVEENDLDIDSDTNYPEWDGSKPDYELAVSCLLGLAERDVAPGSHATLRGCERTRRLASDGSSSSSSATCSRS